MPKKKAVAKKKATRRPGVTNAGKLQKTIAARNQRRKKLLDQIK